MSKVFLAAGHSSTVAGAVSQGYNEAQVAIMLVDKATAILSNQNLNGRQLVVVPHNLDLVPTINWINQNCTDEFHDTCIEVHLNAGGGYGVEVYYYAGSEVSKQFATELLLPLVEHTGLMSRGVKADSTVKWGRLGFIRDTKPLASLIELGFIDTSDLWVTLDKGAMALAKAILRSCGSTFIDHEAIALKEAQAKAEAERIEAERISAERIAEEKRVAEEKARLEAIEEPIETPIEIPIEIKEETTVESEKYELNLNDFKKAAQGSLYTLFGVIGFLIIGFAQEMATGNYNVSALLFAIGAATLSAIGNLLKRFFSDK